MSKKNKQQFDTFEVSEHFDAPAAEDGIEHETTIDGQVTEVDISADDTVTVELRTEEPGTAEDPRVIRSFVGSDIDREDFDSGIGEVGAERNVVLEIADPGDATVAALNMTVDEWKY